MQYSALAPKYARNFTCTGSKCPDNCCHTWCVTIDPATYKEYRTNLEVIPLVEDNIIDNTDLATKEASPGYFKLDPITNQCSLQDNTGLCQLVKKFGPNALCTTCTTYPRNFQQLGEDLMLTLSDSCPVVAKALIKDAAALELDFAPINMPLNPLISAVELPENFNLRQELLQSLITLLRHRELNFEMRLFICGFLIQKVQPLIDNNQAEELQDSIQMFYDLVNTGYFEEQAKKINKKSDSSLGLVILNVIRHHEIKNNSAFNTELDKALKGLNLTDKTVLGVEHINLLDKARKKYLTRLERQLPHALENLVVNWLLDSLFPIKSANLMHGWTNLMARYLLLRTLLSAIGQEQKGLAEEDLIRISYCFGRGITHSSLLNLLIVELIGNKLNNLAAFSLALNP